MATEPSDPRYWKSLRTAYRHYCAENLTLAESFLRRCIGIDPEWWEAYYRLAWVFILRDIGWSTMPGGSPERFQTALTLMRRVSAMAPDESLPWYGRGTAETLSGHHSEAIRAYRTALRLRPEESPNLVGYILSELAYALSLLPEFPSDRGLQEEVLALIAQARRQAMRREAFACVDWGVIHERMGKMDEAVRLYEESLAISPTVPEAMNYLGEFALSKGESRKAEDLFRRALAINPRHPRFQWNLTRLPQAPLAPKG